MKKTKNRLTTFTFPYTKKHYILHPWRWIYDLYWNIRNFLHRGKYGFSYVDAWNICDWYPRVGAEAIRYLARHNSGYPGVYPWTTIEEWREYLEYLAKRLERCANSMDICFGEERNEYAEMMDEIMRHRREEIHNEDGSVTIKHELTPEEEDIRKRYWEREKEIHAADEAYNAETWRWLGEDLSHLWD